jgi:hypothetical protein
MWLLGGVIRSKNVLPRKKKSFISSSSTPEIKKLLLPAFLQCQLLHPVLPTRTQPSDVDPFRPFHFAADPDEDPTCNSDADPDPTFQWIRILLLVKVLRICDNLQTDSPRLNFEPLYLHCERPRSSMAPFETSTAPEF